MDKLRLQRASISARSWGDPCWNSLLIITLIKWQRHPRGAQDSSTQTQTDAISGNQWPLSMGVFIFGNDQFTNFSCERERYIIFPMQRGPWLLQKHIQIRQVYTLCGELSVFRTLNRSSSFLVHFSYALKSFFVSFHSWGVKCSIGCFDLTPIQFSLLGGKSLHLEGMSVKKEKKKKRRHGCHLLLFCN